MITSIKVNNLKGKQVNLIKGYKNQPMLLLFYNNSCLGCTGRAIPLAHDYQQQYSFIQVIGIHSNFNTNQVSEKDIKSIFTNNEIPFPIYIDNNHAVYDDFKCEGTPHWVILSKSGNVVNSIFGSQLGAQTRIYYTLEALKNETNSI